MSSVSLSVWLQSLSLSEYEEVLHQQGFTALHQLRGITQERLKEIGIVKLGHVKRILKNIPLAMNGDEVTPPITPSDELVSSSEEQPQPTKAHVGGGGGEKEVEEASPPAVPRRQRQSSSSLSDSDCHNEGLAVGSPKRNLSPPPMIPLCEDSQENGARRPPMVPRRQQSLINVRRGSREAEDVKASSRHSGRDRQSQRMSLPPDSITSIPGLDRIKSPPPVPLRKSSLTPSPEPTVIPPEVPEQNLLPESCEDSPTKSEPSLDHEIEVNTSAVEPYVDQRLLADGPPSFSPPPSPTFKEEEESREEVKPPSTVAPSYVNVDLLLQVSYPSPTPLPRRTISQKQPVAAPRRKKPSAPSAQPSELHPTDPTSNVQENLSPPEYSVVQRQGLKRADAMKDGYVYTTNTAQPAACPQEPNKEVTAEEYEDMDSPAQPAYETVEAPPPRSGNTPTHMNAVSSSSRATPPLPAGITSAYSEVEMTRNSAYSDVSHTGATPAENSPAARPRSNTRPLTSLHLHSSVSSPDILSPTAPSSQSGDIPAPPRTDRRITERGQCNTYVDLPMMAKGRSASVMVKSSSARDITTQSPQATSLNRGQQMLFLNTQLSVPASPGRRRLGTMAETGDSLIQITPAWARLNESLTQEMYVCRSNA